MFLNYGASLLCCRCAGFVLLEIHAKTSACGACENQSFKVLLLLGLKGFRIHEPYVFEQWASLLCCRCAGFVLLEIHAKTSACGACDNQSFKGFKVV